MSFLKLDNNGNLCEIGGLGDVASANYVEDSHLIFGHHKNEKKLSQIQEEAAKRERILERKRKRAEAEYSQQMGELRKRSLISENKKQAEAKKKNEAFRNIYDEAKRLPLITGNVETLTLNPFAGFSEGDVYIDEAAAEGIRSVFAKENPYGNNTLVGIPPKNFGWSPFDVLNSALEAAVAPVKIIVRTVQTGDVKYAVKSELTDFQRSLMADRTAMQPITDPVLAAAGKVWESKLAVIIRRIVFNKYTDPGYHTAISNRLFAKIPIYNTCYNTVDRYTGEFLTRVELAVGVPARLGRGEYVSKAELISAAIIAMQAAAIIASGGSAAVLISITASQMKQGPIGQTKEGRTLLTLAEIAGYAYAGASAASSASGSAAASSAGTAVAEKTTSEIVTKAVAQKVQQMAAEEAGKKVAKETNTGILGQIIVQGTLGPGTFKDATVAAGKEQAVVQGSKYLGPEGTMIASAVVSASVKTDAIIAAGSDPSKYFQEQLLKELEERAKIEAMHRVEQEVREKLGEPAASIAIAAAKGESFESIAKKELTAQEQKIIADQLKQNDRIIAQLNLQKQAELVKIASAAPDARTALMNNAITIDKQIITKETEKNIGMYKLGYSPVPKQNQLTDNAATLQTPITKQPDYSMSPANKAAAVEKVKAEEAAKLEGYQLKNYECSVNVTNYVGQLKMLTEQATDLRNAGKLVEAAAIEMQMAVLNKLIEQNEADAITYAQMVEVQKMQGAARVAAAEEGRNDLASEFEHPLLKYGLV